MRSPPTCERISGHPSDRLARLEELADLAAVELGPWARSLGSLAAVFAAVQRLPYRPDPPGIGNDDWICDARSTLRHGGDCEDLAVVLVGAARALGIPARLVWFSQPSATLDHVTAEVFSNGSWCWAETTIAGARIGEHPYHAAARLASTRKDLIGG